MSEALSFLHSKWLLSMFGRLATLLPFDPDDGTSFRATLFDASPTFPYGGQSRIANLPSLPVKVFLCITQYFLVPIRVGVPLDWLSQDKVLNTHPVDLNAFSS